jgi:hypothetical protein
MHLSHHQLLAFYTFNLLQSHALIFAVDAMDRQFLNPYLDSVGAPNFQKGCNFATGGSTILPANAASTCPFSFGVQVSQFVRFKDRVLQLLAEGIFYNFRLILACAENAFR